MADFINEKLNDLDIQSKHLEAQQRALDLERSRVKQEKRTIERHQRLERERKFRLELETTFNLSAHRRSDLLWELAWEAGDKDEHSVRYWYERMAKLLAP